MKDPYIRRVAVIRVVDGDTLWLRMDSGWRHYSDEEIRMLGDGPDEVQIRIGINAPEVVGETKAAGLAAKAYAEQWIIDHINHAPADLLNSGWEVKWPFTIWSRTEDSFGRFLADFYCGQEHSLGADMIESGHAVVWVRK